MDLTFEADAVRIKLDFLFEIDSDLIPFKKIENGFVFRHKNWI